MDGIEQQFDRANANKELRRLRRRGPASHTRLLIDALSCDLVNGATLLDIGGGVGTIHHLLLDAAVREAIHVDLSDSYLEAAREEAIRRGRSDRVTFVHGDFVTVASRLPAVDVANLDRVTYLHARAAIATTLRPSC